MSQELTPTAAVVGVTGTVTAQGQPPKRRRLRRAQVIFGLTVLLPTLLAMVYFGLIASDQYISESRFVVRNPQRTPASSGLGALLQGTVFSRSQEDTYSVHDYIRSRDALRELDQKLQVRKHFEAPRIDRLNRFPGLDRDDSFEALHRYYGDHLVIEFDPVSSITVLKVRAYNGEMAQKINEQLLQMGERLVNNLNARSRRDLIDVAEKEVQDAEVKARNAAAAVSRYRSGRNVFDPNAQSGLQLTAVSRLQEELINAEAQLAQMKRLSPNNPQVTALTSQVDTLRKAIAAETAKVLGRDASLSAKAPEYERLVLEKSFADRQLSAALGALDTARNEAARKQLYLERLVQPNLPDVAVEPRRLRYIATVLVVGLLLWGVVSLVVASIREHAD